MPRRWLQSAYQNLLCPSARPGRASPSQVDLALPVLAHGLISDGSTSSVCHCVSTGAKLQHEEVQQIWFLKESSPLPCRWDREAQRAVAIKMIDLEDV